MKTIETPVNSTISTCLMLSMYLCAILTTGISLRWLPDKNFQFTVFLSLVCYVQVLVKKKKKKK